MRECILNLSNFFADTSFISKQADTNQCLTDTLNRRLKVASATFALVCFLNLSESTFQTRKNAFYLTLKALFVLEKVKF